MIKAKSSFKLNLKKLSEMLGSMEITEIRKPFTNTETAEVTTKVIVLSRKDGAVDMYEVTVPGALKETDLKVGDMVDFETATVTLSARGYKAFDGIIAEINTGIRVEKMLRNPKTVGA